MTAADELRALGRAARAFGIETEYVTRDGERREASPEALLATLRALGAPLGRIGDADDARRAHEEIARTRAMPRCVVAWSTEQTEVRLRVSERARWRLELESGEKGRWHDGACVLPAGLPLGAHRLVVEDGDRRESTPVISAPVQVWAPASRVRRLGVFAPLYALHSERSQAGDLRSLLRLARWAAAHGADTVCTLPLLAAFADDPSPYAPVSRLHWNERYLDLGALPEAEGMDLGQLAADPQARLALLAQLSTTLSDARRQGLEQFADAHPDTLAYARFRADAGSGPQPGDGAEAIERLHLYAQWAMLDQLDTLRTTLREAGSALYLDLPLGAHPKGYDVWRWPERFLPKLSLGAPPDVFFEGGQNWRLPPLHPEHNRVDGHRYWAQCLRVHLRVAGWLRIDHVFGLFRQFCIPDSLPATQGVYLRSPTAELMAVLSLESHRAGARIVGEDLGTGPAGVHRTLRRHGLLGIHLGQQQIGADGWVAPRPDCVASLNNHDLFPFAGFWHGDDLTTAARLGRVDEAGLSTARAHRARERAALGADAPEPALDAAHSELAGSDAELFVLSLEDLWLERAPHNVPGTGPDHPNFRRTAALSLEEVEADGSLGSRVAAVARARDRG